MYTTKWSTTEIGLPLRKNQEFEVVWTWRDRISGGSIASFSVLFHEMDWMGEQLPGQIIYLNKNA